MKKTRTTTLLAALVFLVSAAIVFNGCSYVAAARKKNEDSLRSRVVRLWDAKVAMEWGKVYDMTSESFRKGYKRDAYIRTANINFTQYAVKEIEMLPDENEAIVHVDYSISQMGFDFNMSGQEKWVWEKDDWYLEVKAKSPFGK